MADDLIAMLEVGAPGVLVQRETVDAVAAAYAANGHKALTSAQVVAALQTAPVEPGEAAYVPTAGITFPVNLPPYPTGLPRFADSNPTPDPDNWSIDKLEDAV